MTFLKAAPSTLSLSVSLAVWLYVESSQPSFLIFFMVRSIPQSKLSIMTLFRFVSSCAFPRCDSAAVACNEGEKNDLLKSAPRPDPSNSLLYHRELMVTPVCCFSSHSFLFLKSVPRVPSFLLPPLPSAYDLSNEL